MKINKIYSLYGQNSADLNFYLHTLKKKKDS